MDGVLHPKHPIQRVWMRHGTIQQDAVPPTSGQTILRSRLISFPEAAPQHQYLHQDQASAGHTQRR
jgi:hypothetical protein